MRHMKRFMTMLMAAVLLLCMTCALHAADTGSISITNASIGQTYTAYRIFDLESFNETTGAYHYTVNDAWTNFIDSETINGKYVTIDDKLGVLWVEGADAAAFAAAAIAHVEASGISASGSVTASSTGATISNLPLGYYLVDTSLGSLCSLTTVASTAAIVEKNTEPELSLPGVGESVSGVTEVSASIEDTYKQDVVVKVGSITEGYTLHIRHGAGVACSINQPYIQNGSSQEKFTESQYTVSISDGETTVAVSRRLTTGQELHIPLSLKLNNNATVGSDGNVVEVWLTYGSTTTVVSKLKLLTWELPVFKYTGADTPLAGASFKLKSGEAVLYFKKSAEGNVYTVCKNGTGLLDTITTDSTGRFTVRGLASGSYSLTETQAPEGYSSLTEPLTVIIADDGSIHVGSAESGAVGEIKVLNQSGVLLPTTGGIGSTVVTCTGLVILLISATLFALQLHTKKRAK